MDGVGGEEGRNIVKTVLGIEEDSPSGKRYRGRPRFKVILSSEGTGKVTFPLLLNMTVIRDPYSGRDQPKELRRVRKH